MRCGRNDLYPSPSLVVTNELKIISHYGFISEYFCELMKPALNVTLIDIHV